MVCGSSSVESRRSRKRESGARLRKVANGVEAGVGPELLQQARVVVPQGAEVKLLGPAAAGIPATKLRIRNVANFA